MAYDEALAQREGSLMARVGPQNYDRALAAAGVRVMDFTGRPMDVVAGLPAKRSK